MEPTRNYVEELGSLTSVENVQKTILDRYSDVLQSLQNNRRAVIFGAQGLGLRTQSFLRSKGIETDFFVDNNPGKQGTQLGGRPVQGPASILGQDSPVVIATTRYIPEIGTQLRQMGFSKFIDYPALTIWDPKAFPVEIPYVGIHEDLVHHVSEYAWLSKTLADDKSRRVLNGLIRYRLTLDPVALEGIYDPPESQYFDRDILNCSTDEVFVDGGGFDGLTTRIFADFVGQKYKKVLYFEPSPAMCDKSKKLLGDLANVQFFCEGLFSDTRTVGFTTTANVDGKISDDGDMKIQVRPLDSLHREQPTFIKLDIEGAESEALKGAAEIIRDFKPKLAIAAYHKGEDLWALPRMILSLRPDYKIYLRHYTKTGLESVVFAV